MYPLLEVVNILAHGHPVRGVLFENLLEQLISVLRNDKECVVFRALIGLALDGLLAEGMLQKIHHDTDNLNMREEGRVR